VLKRYALVIMFLFLTIIGVTGCRQAVELDRTVFPVILGVDFNEQENVVESYGGIVTIGSSSSSTGQSNELKKSYNVIYGRGETLLEAMEDMTGKASQSIHWKQINTVVMTERIAKRGIVGELDTLTRLQQIHLNADFLLTSEDLNELLSIKPKLESSLPSQLSAIQLISKQSSRTIAVTLKDFLITYLCMGRGSIVPIVSIFNNADNEPSNKQRQQSDSEQSGSGKQKNGEIFDYLGLGIFNEDKLVGKLSIKDSMNVTYVYGALETSGPVLYYTSKRGIKEKLSLNKVSTVSRIIPYIKDNVPSITVKIQFDYNIGSSDVSEKICIDEVQKFNSQVELFMKQEIEGVFRKLQQDFKSDIFGVGEKIHSKYPKYWEANKYRWEDIFSTIKIDVQIKAKMKSTGQLINSLKYIKEQENI